MLKFRDGIGINYLYSKLEKSRGTILMCHGFLDNLMNYDSIAAYFLKENFSCLRFDARGHGKTLSPQGDVEHYDIMLEDIDMFCNLILTDNPNEPIYLMGTSMGGLLSALYELKYPHKVKAHIYIAGAVGKVPMVCGRNERLLSLGGVFARKSYVELGKERFSIHSRFYDIKGKSVATLGFIKSVFADGSSYLLNHLSDFKAPIFLAQGMKDKIVPVAIAEHFYNSIASETKELKFYENSGHVIFVSEAREACLRDVLTWIKGVEDEEN